MGLQFFRLLGVLKQEVKKKEVNHLSLHMYVYIEHYRTFIYLNIGKGYLCLDVVVLDMMIP